MGGLEATPIERVVKGRFLVLSKADVGAKKSFTVFSINPRINGVDELIPLELASANESDPYYVLDKEMALEYLVYIDAVEGPRGCSSFDHFHHEQDVGCSSDVIDLTKDDTNLSDHNVHMSTSKLILDSNSPIGILQKMISDCETIEEVNEIPEIYNGNVVFELPPLLNPLHSKMFGMEQSHDGHVWTKPAPTHVKFQGVVRKSSCGGAFECVNPLCGSLATTGSTNRTAWKGQQCSKLIVYQRGFICGAFNNV